MARKTVFVSDLSGEPLDEESAVRIAFSINGERWDLDVKRSEVEHFIQAGRKSKVRGRKKKQPVAA